MHLNELEAHTQLALTEIRRKLAELERQIESAVEAIPADGTKEERKARTLICRAWTSSSSLRQYHLQEDIARRIAEASRLVTR